MTNDPFSTPVCSPNSPDLEGVKAPPRSISNFTSFPQTFTTPLSLVTLPFPENSSLKKYGFTAGEKSVMDMEANQIGGATGGVPEAT